VIAGPCGGQKSVPGLNGVRNAIRFMTGNSVHE
jgi:hypothetical protein